MYIHEYFKSEILHFYKMITELQLKEFKQEHNLCGLYFKTANCGVCHVLLPRVEELFQRYNVPLMVIDLTENMHLSGAEMVMSAPVLKIFAKERQVFKEGAYMDLKKVGQLLFQYSAAKPNPF
ncbi:MAG: hypothetical protein CL843_14385 [Crocinitomicaceae bacterium]|nr:hypothetical protein [Crocinitomicaceae bacterium]|tara:strand:+ start:2070 stop:2438 length:369 start_codon:yes stop_codon:yes gene_type:complete